MWFIGIDPGKTGGVAAVSSDGNLLPVLLKLEGATERDVLNWLHDLDLAGAFAVLEKPGATPGLRNFSALTKLHDSVGFLRGLLVGVGVPFDWVPPGVWQGVFGLKRTDKEESDTAKKNRHKQAAERLFPGVKVTHAIADALLLAEHAKRTWNARNRASA